MIAQDCGNQCMLRYIETTDVIVGAEIYRFDILSNGKLEICNLHWSAELWARF